MYQRVMHYIFYGVRTSLYTIFFVNISYVAFFFPFPFPFPLFTSFSAADTAKIIMFDLVVALNSATYNWPCKYTGSGKYTPTLGIVCPCVGEWKRIERAQERAIFRTPVNDSLMNILVIEIYYFHRLTHELKLNDYISELIKVEIFIYLH